MMTEKTFNDEQMRGDWCMVFSDHVLMICLRFFWTESGKDRYQCRVGFHPLGQMLVQFAFSLNIFTIVKFLFSGAEFFSL